MRKKESVKPKIERLLEELKGRVAISDEEISLLRDFYKYRNEIKKPIKTYRGLGLFLKEVRKIKEAGYDVQQAIDLMKEREWQTVTLEYVKKALPKSDSSQPQFVWW